jgi:hypothetical protein
MFQRSLITKLLRSVPKTTETGGGCISARDAFEAHRCAFMISKVEEERIEHARNESAWDYRVGAHEVRSGHIGDATRPSREMWLDRISAQARGPVLP